MNDYQRALERKLQVESILGRLSRGDLNERTARKQIGILVGRGFFDCYGHHAGQGTELYDVRQVCLVAGRQEGYVVASRRSGPFKGEVVLIPLLDPAFSFFGIVSRDGYSGPQFARSRLRKKRKQALRAVA